MDIWDETRIHFPTSKEQAMTGGHDCHLANSSWDTINSEVRSVVSCIPISEIKLMMNWGIPYKATFGVICPTQPDQCHKPHPLTCGHHRVRPGQAGPSRSCKGGTGTGLLLEENTRACGVGLCHHGGHDQRKLGPGEEWSPHTEGLR